MMKTIKAFISIICIIYLTILVADSSFAAYYGIYDIRSDSGSIPLEWPGTEHFDWINRTYTYNSGDSYEMKIDVRMWASNNWDASGIAPPVDYSNYKVEDQSYSGTVIWDSAVPALDQTFDNVYSYFYQVTFVGDSTFTQLASLNIPYDPAVVKGYGYIDDTGLGQAPTSMSTTSSSLSISFSGSELDDGEFSEWIFMTSEYWWGWQPLTYNSGTPATGFTPINSVYSSPEGMIPAPNPEAPTVALYIAGLFGMLWVTRMKFRRELIQ